VRHGMSDITVDGIALASGASTEIAIVIRRR
jgi:hypothetical protein